MMCWLSRMWTGEGILARPIALRLENSPEDRRRLRVFIKYANGIEQKVIDARFGEIVYHSTALFPPLAHASAMSAGTAETQSGSGAKDRQRAQRRAA